MSIWRHCLLKYRVFSTALKANLKAWSGLPSFYYYYYCCCCCCDLKEQMIGDWEGVWFKLNMPPWSPLPKRWFKNRHWAREFSRLTFLRGREKLLQCPLAKYTHFSLYGWQRSRVHLFGRKRAWNNHTAEPPETGGGMTSDSRAQGVPVRFFRFFFFSFLKEKAFWEVIFLPKN